MGDDWLGTTTAATAESDVAALRDRRFWHLAVLITPELAQAGGLVPVAAGEVDLGRGSFQVDGVPVADRLLSRRQARFEARGDGSAMVTDLGSRHGTWLNGAQLPPDIPTAVRDGDVLRVGRTSVGVVRLPPDPEGWERDLATRRVSHQRKDPESRAKEVKAVAAVQRWLAAEALVGESASHREARRGLLAAARLDGPVLVTGPSGTGKEAAAEAVHRASLRRRGPKAAFSCAEVAPELVVSELFGAVKGAFTGADRDRAGLWAQAQGGTLLLDEVADAPPELQAALLRVVETGEVRPVGAAAPRQTDVRLVAATKRALDTDVEAGRFREDLWFRLAASHVRLSPLAERPMDALRVLAAALRRHGLERAIVEARFQDLVLAHTWPGNGREVMHIAAQAAADAIEGRHGLTLRAPPSLAELGLSRTARARPLSGDLPAAPAPPPVAAAKGPRTGPGPSTHPTSPGKPPTPAPEPATLERVLREEGGNVARAARRFDVRRQQIYRWCDRFGIDLETLRPGSESDGSV